MFETFFTFTVFLLQFSYLLAEPLRPSQENIGSLDCGTQPLITLNNLQWGYYYKDELIPDGDVKLLKNTPTTGAVTMQFKSGSLKTAGISHTVSTPMDPLLLEDFFRGEIVVMEIKADLPKDSSGKPALSHTTLKLSFGIQNEDGVMYEFYDTYVDRDDEWHLVSFQWKNDDYRRMYKHCQTNKDRTAPEAGVCTDSTDCTRLGGTLFPSQGIAAGTFITTGCQKIKASGVQCCVGGKVETDALKALHTEAVPLTQSKKATHMSIRVYSEDSTSADQSISIKRVSICGDPCKGTCDDSKGMACDFPSKTCMCKNSYPWVLAKGKCIYEFSLSDSAYECKACPDQSSHTYYRLFTSPAEPVTGADRTVCIVDFSPVPVGAPERDESCCGYRCHCKTGYRRVAGSFLGGLINCQPLSGTTTPSPKGGQSPSPVPTCKDEDCTKPHQRCVFGSCGCEYLENWKATSETDDTCVKDCGAYCADATLCRQPENDEEECKCKAGYTGTKSGSPPKWVCSKECSGCTAPKVCVNGACACEGTMVDDGTGGCKPPTDKVDEKEAQDAQDARDKENAAKKCTPEDCDVATTGKTCDSDMTPPTCVCPDYHKEVDGKCVDPCAGCAQKIRLAQCDPGTGVCECPSTHTINSSGNECIRNSADPDTPGSQTRLTPKPNGEDKKGLFNSGIGDDLSSDDQLTVILIAVGAVVCCIIICGVLVCACVYYAMGSKNDYVQPNQTYNGNYNGSQHSVISDAYAGGGGSFNDPTMSPGYATNGYAGSAYPSVMGGTGDIPNGYANEKSPY